MHARLKIAHTGQPLVGGQTQLLGVIPLRRDERDQIAGVYAEVIGQRVSQNNARGSLWASERR